MRIISLVPSTTETLFALGVGHHVVGRTAFCVLPREALTVPEVGGTKTPNIERIAALQPDLILVNAEENRAEDVAAAVAYLAGPSGDGHGVVGRAEGERRAVADKGGERQGR